MEFLLYFGFFSLKIPFLGIETSILKFVRVLNTYFIE